MTGNQAGADDQEPRGAQDGANPQVGEGAQNPQAGAEQGTGASQEGALEGAALAAELKRVRAEAAGYRTKLRRFEEADQQRSQAAMSDLEKAQAQAAQAQAQMTALQEQLNQRIVRQAVMLAAAQAGFADPADAWRFVDVAELTIADDESVAGVDEAIKGLTKAKPYLLKAARTIGPSPTNAAGAPARSSDDQLRKELFGNQAGAFWGGGGVAWPVEKE